MNFLTIDTTKATAYVVAKINNVEYIEKIDSSKKHNESLLPTIDLLLTKADVSLKDIDCIGAIVGPGSFTGIRVGISTVKAFCCALDKKSFSLTNFDVLKDDVNDGVVLIPCTRTSMYFGEIQNKNCISYGVISNEDAEKRFANANVYLLDKDNLDRFEKFANVNSDIDFARAIMNASLKKISTGTLCDSNELESFYIELSQAEREANARDKCLK